MKKIFLAFFMVCAMLTSCDMNKTPWGTLDDETALTSMNDYARFRNNFYVGLKGMGAGSYHAIPDIQADQFIGLICNGNRVGQISNAIFNSSDGDITSYWAGMYSRINGANFFIERAQAAVDGGKFAGEDLTEMKRFIGEAKFYRAYCYWMLLDKFCEDYTKVGGSTAAKGLPLVTVYNPTGDTSKYPGRSTQDETYTLIETDLNEAFAALTEYENAGLENNLKPMANYLSSMAVEALQARVALLKGDMQTAYNKATDVIESGLYTLSTVDNYATMWENDKSKEIIMQAACSKTELPGSTGAYFLSTDLKKADYIPSAKVILDYNGRKDVRFDLFFQPTNLTIEGSKYQCFVLTKYLGNPDLMTDANPNFRIAPKLFRLSEMYLIAAEAGIKVNMTGANKYINDFKRNRYEDYVDGTYDADKLLAAVKHERGIEFIGEGFRLSDLRRWGDGFDRDINYNINSKLNNVVVKLGKVSYSKDDYRYVWPIPSDELTNNPQLKGQQNPGY